LELSPQDTDLVTRARELATLAHANQVDKAGLPYIGHVGRVAARVAAAGHPAEAVAAAWLHDVLEDQPEHAPAVLMFPPSVVVPVRLLTRRPGISPEDYYAAIRDNATALAVKDADIGDNSSPERLALLPIDAQQRLLAKYAKARAALGLS